MLQPIGLQHFLIHKFVLELLFCIVLTEIETSLINVSNNTDQSLIFR